MDILRFLLHCVPLNKMLKLKLNIPKFMEHGLLVQTVPDTIVGADIHSN